MTLDWGIGLAFIRLGCYFRRPVSRAPRGVVGRRARTLVAAPRNRAASSTPPGACSRSTSAPRPTTSPRSSTLLHPLPEARSLPPAGHRGKRRKNHGENPIGSGSKLACLATDEAWNVHRSATVTPPAPSE